MIWTGASDLVADPQKGRMMKEKMKEMLKGKISRGFGSLSRLRDDEGAVTAEYAVVIMGAVAFAGVLVAIMRSGEVRAFLLSLVEQALGSAG